MTSRAVYIHIVLILVLTTYNFAETLTASDGFVEAKAKISACDITLAGKVDVEVSYEPAEDVSGAKLTAAAEEVELTIVSEDAGRISAVIEPLKPGELDVLLKFEYIDQEDTENVFGLGEISLSVATSLTEEEIQSLQTPEKSEVIAQIAKTDDLRTPPYSPVILLAVIFGLLILAAGFLIIAKKRRDKIKEQKKYVVVHNIAYRLLDDLQFMDLPEKGEFKLYYSYLSNILRYYIEYRFKIQAPDMTTEEFLERVRYSNELDGVDRGGIERFFEISDMVKFAKFEPTSEQANEAMESVRKFVSDTQDYLCVIEQKQAEEFERILEVEND